MGAEASRIGYRGSMTTINLMDETAGRRMPVKPAYGRPCNGCGYCCSAEVCDLAREYLAATVAPCPALECQDGRFWCGLVRQPSRYMALPDDRADLRLGGLFAEVLGVGRGCDASDA